MSQHKPPSHLKVYNINVPLGIQPTLTTERWLKILGTWTIPLLLAFCTCHWASKLVLFSVSRFCRMLRASRFLYVLSVNSYSVWKRITKERKAETYRSLLHLLSSWSWRIPERHRGQKTVVETCKCRMFFCRANGPKTDAL